MFNCAEYYGLYYKSFTIIIYNPNESMIAIYNCHKTFIVQNPMFVLCKFYNHELQS